MVVFGICELGFLVDVDLVGRGFLLPVAVCGLAFVMLRRFAPILEFSVLVVCVGFRCGRYFSPLAYLG